MAFNVFRYVSRTYDRTVASLKVAWRLTDTFGSGLAAFDPFRSR